MSACNLSNHGKFITLTERRAALLGPGNIGDKDGATGGLRGADGQAGFDAATAVPDRELQRQR